MDKKESMKTARKFSTVDLSPTNVFSPICFRVNRVKKWKWIDDISSEDHFENLNTKRGSYFLLELFIFANF